MAWKMDDRPLRILTAADVPPDPNSGAAGTVYATNVALRELGHEVDEIWTDDLGPRRIRHGNLHSLLEQPRAYRKAVRRRIADKDYDVIQMSQPQAYLAARDLKRRGFRGIVVNRSHGVELRVNAVLRTWHQRLGIPGSQFPRSLLSKPLGWLLERQWLEIPKVVDGVIVGCHKDRSFLVERSRLDPKTVRTISHGVSESLFFGSTPELTANRLRQLLHVGQFAFFKGIHVLVRIVNKLLVEEPSLTFTWVCSSRNHPQVRALIEPRLQSRITLLEHQTQEELKRVYDQHGVFLFPSLFEGFGKAPLEAMARGLCVVASDEGGMHDYIEDGLNGHRIPVGDVDAFVQVVRSLIGNLDQCRELSARARKTAERYCWRRCATEAVQFYKELLTSKCVIPHR